jgi:hypothetical protein
MLKKLALAGLALAILGCASEPKEEKMKASKAKESAEAAKAAVYAKETYDAGVKSWTSAEAANGKEDFDKAKKGYMEAEAKFKAAAAEAPDKEKSAMEEATKMMETMNADKASMMKDRMVMNAMKGKDKGKYADMMKEVDNLMTEAAGMMESDAIGAMEKMTMAKAKMDEMMGMMKPGRK